MRTKVLDPAKAEQLKAAIAMGGKNQEFDFGQLKTGIQIENLDAKTIKIKAEKISETVFASSVDYHKILKSIETLESLDLHDLQITGKVVQLRNLHEEKKRIENLLAKAPEGVSDQFAVDLLQLIINETEPKTDSQILFFINLIKSGGPVVSSNNLLKIGKRGREGQTDEKGDIFFYDDHNQKHNLFHILSQLPGREGQISGADKKLFAALRGLIKRYLVYKQQAKEAAVAEDATKLDEIKAKIPENSFHPRNIAKVIPKIGRYYLFLPGKMEGEKKVGQDGACIIEVINRNSATDQPFYVIKLIDGAGSMRIIANNKGNFFSHWWFMYYRKKKCLPKNVPDDMHDPILAICRKLDAAIAYANAQSRR